MSSVQYEIAVHTHHEPIDYKGQMGVHSNEVERRLRNIMSEIRASGKCGMLVVRWDGQAWNIHRCDPPCRVNET